jgi:hypothetical protein
MRSGSLAEAMLVLFTSPDRASSTIGDLAEQAQSHGRVWFWLQVLRTTAALFWRDLFEAPLRISALLVVGIIPHSLMAGSMAFPLAQLAGWTPMFGPLLAALGVSAVGRAAGSCGRSARREEDGDPRRSSPANDNADGRKCPPPNGLRASGGSLQALNGPQSLHKPHSASQLRKARNVARVTFTTGC